MHRNYWPLCNDMNGLKHESIITETLRTTKDNQSLQTWESSRKEEPGSMRRSILSRGSSLFLLLFLLTASAPPPPSAFQPPNTKTTTSSAPEKHSSTRNHDANTQSTPQSLTRTFWTWDWSCETRSAIAPELRAYSSEPRSTPSGSTPRQNPRRRGDGTGLPETARRAKALSIAIAVRRRARRRCCALRIPAMGSGRFIWALAESLCGVHIRPLGCVSFATSELHPLDFPNNYL